LDIFALNKISNQLRLLKTNAASFFFFFYLGIKLPLKHIIYSQILSLAKREGMPTEKSFSVSVAKENDSGNLV